MKRRTALTLFLSLFLFLTAMLSQSTMLTFAETDPFSMNVVSPKQNQLYNSTNIDLNFTITETGLCKILTVKYYLDGLASEKTSVSGRYFWNDYNWLYHSLPLDFPFAQKIENLSQGLHTLTVSVEYNDTNDEYSSYTRTLNSTKIDFAVNRPIETQLPSSSPSVAPPNSNPPHDLSPSSSVPEFPSMIIPLVTISAILLIGAFANRKMGKSNRT